MHLTLSPYTAVSNAQLQKVPAINESSSTTKASQTEFNTKLINKRPRKAGSLFRSIQQGISWLVSPIVRLVKPQKNRVLRVNFQEDDKQISLQVDRKKAIRSSYSSDGKLLLQETVTKKDEPDKHKLLVKKALDYGLASTFNSISKLSRLEWLLESIGQNPFHEVEYQGCGADGQFIASSRGKDSIRFIMGKAELVAGAEVETATGEPRQYEVFYRHEAPSGHEKLMRYLKRLLKSDGPDDLIQIKKTKTQSSLR